MGFGSYLIARSLTAVITVSVLLCAVFFILYVIPGDPVYVWLPDNAPPDQVQQARQELGLDQPLSVQFFKYISGLMTFDLGQSWWLAKGRPVAELLLDHFPTTVELTVTAMSLGVLFGIGFGLISSSSRFFDHVIRIVSLAGFSIPLFLSGTLAQWFFGIQLKILPIWGRSDTFLSPEHVTGLYLVDGILTLNFPAFVNTLVHLALPAITLGFFCMSVICRVTRVEMASTFGEDYIRTAKAKGLPKRTIIIHHAFRNAVLPVMTVSAFQFGTLLAGAIITESVFNLPGMGTLLLDAMNSRDLPVVRGCITLSVIWIGMVSIVVDLLYAYLDPRIKF